MANKTISLVVGCGGSGITTMTSLNRLLAENPEIRNRIHRDVFYIAVDTEVSMLNKFPKDVENQMCGAQMPLIEKVLLSQDINVLNSIIKPWFEDPFEGRPDDPGLKRLKENWWFRPRSEDPFRAPDVFNLLEGAGQCPPASYCLAWYKLAQIERSIENIIKAIKRRGTGDPGVLKNLNVFIVAGLSGGTGRGSWNMIMFKIRQCFEKQGVPVSPIGIFFDANVFDNVMKKTDSSQRRSIRVNSLTGLSELSCWMKAGREQAPGKMFRFRLPNIRRPENEETDVLDMSVAVAPTAGAPIDSAYLVCGQSKAAVLLDNKQYHEMAGTALYAMITNSDIKGERVNNSNPYNSFAATTFEVDTLRIQAYFETIARGVALENLAGSDTPVADRVSDFLARVPLEILVQGKDDVRPAKGDNATLIQRVCAQIVEQCKGAFQSLAEDLPTLSPDNAEEEACQAVQGIVEAVTVKMVKEALAGAIKSLGKDFDPLSDLKKEIEKVYKGKRGERSSLGRVRNFLNGILERVQTAKDMSEEEFTFEDPTGETQDQLPPGDWIEKKVRLFSGRTFMEKVTGGKPFNKREVAQLIKKNGTTYIGDVVDAVLLAAYPKLRKALEDYFNPIMKYIGDVIEGCNKFASFCRRVKNVLEEEAPAAAGGKTGDDPFKLLFVTPDRIEDSLPSDDDPTRFYRRVLKPIFKDEGELRGLLLKDENLRIERGMDEFVQKLLDPQSGTLLRLVQDDDASFERDFRKALKETVIANVSVDDTLLEREFTFLKVLERNRPFWNEQIKKLQGLRNRRAVLFNRFEQTLGLVPEKIPGSEDYELPPADDIILAISKSMAASCAPWWITDVGPEDNAYTVEVFLPEDEQSFRNGSEFKDQLEQSMSYAQVDVIWKSAKNGGVTPFSVITFTADCVPQLTDVEVRKHMHPLDKVRSFDYYTDAEVNKWLGWAEDPRGLSIFETRDNNKGIGYVSPIFVRNPVLSKSRWRPWVKDEDSTIVDAAIEAMRYAFLGQGLEGEEAEDVAQEFKSRGWSFPLLVLGDKQKYSLKRKTLLVDENGKVAPNRAAAWKTTKDLCQSLCNLYTFFQGLGKVGLRGKATEKDKEEGNAIREMILKEKAGFEAALSEDLGKKFINRLVEARDGWFESMRDDSDEDDRPIWDLLLGNTES